MRRAPFWTVALSLLGVVACADVWSFSDLEEGGVVQDATTGGDAVERAESGADAIADGAEEADDSSLELPDAPVEAGESGEAGVSPREGGVTDGGDDGAAAAACKAHCSMGCCDAQGVCRTTLSATYCGANGDACQACSSAG
ncbi:MAG TPA: hypothetical protein VK762_36500, partial [Polyangiaceae bacterium]|nr:hypothetical protein [Polyangiaceae bacterium]